MNPLCTGPPRRLPRSQQDSGTTEAHEAVTSSREMMLPGESEATGKTFGDHCPSDPLLQ